MTIKLIEMQVEIPDSVIITNEELTEIIQAEINGGFLWNSHNLPDITEIKVTKTSPSFYPHKPTDETIPVVPELHDEGEQHEENFNTEIQ